MSLASTVYGLQKLLANKKHHYSHTSSSNYIYNSRTGSSIIIYSHAASINDIYTQF